MTVAPFEPAYLALLRSGELARRVAEAYEHLAACDVCPRGCLVDRRAGELGVCKTGERARVSSFGAHLGEEDPLRGWRGSGTIFFSRCNLHCQYCQNVTAQPSESKSLSELEKLSAWGRPQRLTASGCGHFSASDRDFQSLRVRQAEQLPAHGHKLRFFESWNIGYVTPSLHPSMYPSTGPLMNSGCNSGCTREGPQDRLRWMLAVARS